MAQTLHQEARRAGGSGGPAGAAGGARRLAETFAPADGRNEGAARCARPAGQVEAAGVVGVGPSPGWRSRRRALDDGELCMATLWQDLRFGVRMLRRNPLTSALALLILTLGIGANTAIFSVISGGLLEPLPFPQPEELILVVDSAPRHGFPRFAASPPNFNHWRRQNRSFATLDAFAND